MFRRGLTLLEVAHVVAQLPPADQPHHPEVVAQVAQDRLLHLAVVAEPAAPARLEQQVRTRIQRLDVVAEVVLEGDADELGTVTCAEFERATRHLGGTTISHSRCSASVFTGME
jgi:hypothetical protein